MNEQEVWVLSIQSQMLDEGRTLVFATKELAKEALLKFYDAREEERHVAEEREACDNPTREQIANEGWNCFTAMSRFNRDTCVDYIYYRTDIRYSANNLLPNN